MRIISFPKIADFDAEVIQEPYVYIGAAGFEDRALAVLSKTKQSAKKFKFVIGLDYEPYSEGNKKEEFQELASAVVLSDSNIKWFPYNREVPGKFDVTLNLIREICSQAPNVCLDISAMSKFLILILLQALRDLPISLTIAYTEAGDYHPTEQEYREGIAEITETRESAEFLTTGGFEVVTTSALASVAMRHYPTALVAFPNFDPKLLSALQQEITPQELILVEGEPFREANKWRLDAIRNINKHFYSSAKRTKTVSTFYYQEIITVLEKLNKDYQFTHEFIVSSPNSKLQTVGVYFFKQMHPEVPLIYPTPRSFFFDSYTEGIKAICQIIFPDFQQFIQNLNDHRYNLLEEFGANIASRDLITRQFILLHLIRKLLQKGLHVDEPTLQRLIYQYDREATGMEGAEPLYKEFVRTQFGPFNEELFYDIKGMKDKGLLNLDDCMLILTNSGRQLLAKRKVDDIPQAQKLISSCHTILGRVYPLEHMLKVDIGSNLP